MFQFPDYLYHCQPPHFHMMIAFVGVRCLCGTRLYSLTGKDWLCRLLGRSLCVTCVWLCAVLVSVSSLPSADRVDTSSFIECSTNPTCVVCTIPPYNSCRNSQLYLNCVHSYQVRDIINLIIGKLPRQHAITNCIILTLSLQYQL